MKKSLKLAAALTAAALVGGAAFAQAKSNTNKVTFGVFSTDVDNYGNVRNWSTVNFDKAFVAADGSISTLSIGGAGRVGSLYTAGWYTGNVLWRGNPSTNGTNAKEDGSYNVLLGLGADGGMPIGVKLGFAHSGTNIHKVDELLYTPSLAVGLRMPNLGAIDLFRAELSVTAPIYAPYNGSNALADSALGGSVFKANTISTQINPLLRLQAGIGANTFTLSYAPTFAVGDDSDFKKTVDSYAWSTHAITLEYSTSKNFGNGLAVGTNIGANFSLESASVKASGGEQAITNIETGPYLQGGIKWAVNDKFTWNLGAEVRTTLTSDETKNTNGNTTIKNHSWEWTPEGKFGTGFVINMTENAWLDTALVINTSSLLQQPNPPSSDVGISTFNDFVSGLKIQAAIKF